MTAVKIFMYICHPLGVSLHFNFLLKQLKTNISPMINVKICLLIVAVVILMVNTIELVKGLHQDKWQFSCHQFGVRLLLCLQCCYGKSSNQHSINQVRSSFRCEEIGQLLSCQPRVTVTSCLFTKLSRT